jgi:hypothetical protein
MVETYAFGCGITLKTDEKRERGRREEKEIFLISLSLSLSLFVFTLPHSLSLSVIHSALPLTLITTPPACSSLQRIISLI